MFIMEITVENAGYEIIASAAFLMENPQSELLLHITDEGSHFGDITVHFTDIPDQKDEIKADFLNGSLTLTCINFNNALGTGTSVPFEIGSISGKKLILHLWSYFLGNRSVRKVEYTLYKEK